MMTLDSGKSFPSSRSRTSGGRDFDFRLGDPRGLSKPSRMISNLGPRAANEFHAAVKPPKPVANGLFGPLDINSCKWKRIFYLFKLITAAQTFSM